MDSIDLGTPSGRLIAHVPASVAAYETEIRGERVRAGQAVVMASGKKWGGSKKGRRSHRTESASCRLHRKGGQDYLPSIATSPSLLTRVIVICPDQNVKSKNYSNFHFHNFISDK